jgi:bacillithiol biosynthesis cysteine-adding enzyme BshC
MLKPVFRKELTGSAEACRAVIGQSELLEGTYHAQVKPKSVNAFLFHEKGRFPIEPHPDGFALKGVRKHFTREELLELLDRSPESFSPNVVLRPICQDTLLPTVAYVAGPAEVAYFAQLRPLYDLYQLPFPLLYPRASATLLEEKVDKVLTRFEVDVVQLFKDLEGVRTKIAASVSDFKAEELFAATIGSVEESINSLRSGITSIDPTLSGTIDNTLSKVTSGIETLKQKTIAAQKRQHDVYLRQIDKAWIHLAPEGSPQERSVSIVYFLNKYGLDFVRWLSGELRFDAHNHQLLRL